MTKNDQLIQLEAPTSFSQSKIWSLQKQYFDDEGINAWSGAVPFYVTNNAVIANAYVNMAVRYLQDLSRAGKLNPEEPIYFAELGTGSGKFSYLFLRLFNKLLKQLNLTHIKYCYVMTDFTPANLQFWDGHEKLRPFIDQGVLDFAIFNLETDTQFQLHYKKTLIQPGSLKNPLIVIADYIFDTVKHDAFYCKKGELFEGLLELRIKASDLVNDKPRSLELLETDFTSRPLEKPFYKDQTLNDILNFYKDNLEESTFLIPIGGITALNNLRKLNGKGEMLVIAGDKSYTTMDSLEHLANPHIAFHGSFSMMVNFDAMGRYVKMLGGDACLASDAEGFKINLFCFNQKMENLPETALAYEEFNTHFSIREFLLIKNKIIEHAKSSNIKDLIAVLKLSYWDPDILFSLAQAMAEKLPHAPASLQKECYEGMAELEKNYYFIPHSKNVLFEVGNMYYCLDHFEQAIECYVESIKQYGENTHVCFNLGLSQFKTGQVAKATNQFKKALKYDPNNKTAQEWVNYISSLALPQT